MSYEEEMFFYAFSLSTSFFEPFPSLEYCFSFYSFSLNYQWIPNSSVQLIKGKDFGQKFVFNFHPESRCYQTLLFSAQTFFFCTEIKQKFNTFSSNFSQLLPQFFFMIKLRNNIWARELAIITNHALFLCITRLIHSKCTKLSSAMKKVQSF